MFAEYEFKRRTQGGNGADEGWPDEGLPVQAPPAPTRTAPDRTQPVGEFGHRFAEYAIFDDDDADQDAPGPAPAGDQAQGQGQGQGQDAGGAQGARPGGAGQDGAQPDGAGPGKADGGPGQKDAQRQVIGPPDQEPVEGQAQTLLRRLGEGTPLSGGAAARFGPIFGESLGQVRVHESTPIASELNARAFTVGSHIGFAPGAYNPGTLEGDALLAHELAHVIQQEGRPPAFGEPDVGEELERDADHAALRALERLHGEAGETAEAAQPALRSGLGLRRCGSSQPTPTLQLQVTKPTIKLNETTDLKVAAQGQAPAQAGTPKVKYEIKRSSGGSWTKLHESNATTFNYEGKAAGNFKVRATASAGGGQAQSPEQNLEVQFPTYSDIVGDGAVVTHTDQAWTNTKAATSATSRREEGFYIIYNSNTRAYEFGPTVLGPAVGPTVGASMSPGAKPPDNPASPVPPNGAKYTVAHCHTHTPTTHRTVGRPVGPSGADTGFANGQNIVGIAYDYTDAGGGNIPAGHPLNSPAQRYHFGPNRRSTP